jgi:hypothetical protein
LLYEGISIRTKVIVAVLGIVYEVRTSIPFKLFHENPNTAKEISYVITFGPWLARWLNLDFSTAVDIDHENDRYTAFTILVLGEFTYAILVGSPAKGGLNLNVMRAVWTLVIAFCFDSMDRVRISILFDVLSGAPLHGF